MYDGPNKEENVLLGVKNSVNQVNNFKFNGNILVDNTNYEIEGKAILKDNIASSIIFIKMKILMMNQLQKILLKKLYKNILNS